MKDKLFSRKTLSFALCLLLISACLSQSLSADESDVGIQSRASETVIEEALAVAMKEASDSDLIPVAIWVDEVDTGKIEEDILKELGINKTHLELLSTLDEHKSNELIDEYILQERKIYSELQSEKNREYWEELINERAINAVEDKRLYICSYSPTIITELTKQEIESASKNKHTREILYYSAAFERPVDEDVFFEEDEADEVASVLSNSTETALASIRVSDVHALGYTGSGIKIGQVEVHAPNTSYFGSASITVRPASASDINLHATRVMEMMLNVAPNAQYYCTTYVLSFEESIEWVLSQGVNVINNSAAGTVTGQYVAQEKWLDHLALNHSVHFVQPAGNNTSTNVYKYICRPGMAYNVITVGGANAALNARSSGSSYVQYGVLSNTKYADKPDILAPGQNLYFSVPDESGGHTSSGTSFAAPIVTGIAALMMQSRVQLKVLQDALKSCMLASINNSTLRYTPSQTLYGECGAGLVDAYSSFITAMLGQYTANQYFSAGTSTLTKTYTFTTTNTDTIKRVALTWLQNNQVSGSNHSGSSPTVGNYVDLDLRVYGPSGTLVGTSSRSYGNVEIVQFVPQPNTTYTVQVRAMASPQQTAYFSVAWW